MKKVSLGALALAIGIGAFAGTADAQAIVRPYTIGISGGPSLPTGDFADEANLGYHVQGSVGFGLGGVGVRGDLLWQELPMAEESGMARQIGGLGNVVLAVPMMVISPYLLVGGGYINSSIPHGDHTDSESGFGFNAGAGIQFPFVGMSAVLEARYLGLFGAEAVTHHRTIPISFGIRF